MRYVLLTSPYCLPWVTQEDDNYLQDHPSMYTLIGTYDTLAEAKIARKHQVELEEQLTEADCWDGDDADKISY